MADVSVIIPTFNEEKNLGKCIKSIKSQKTHLDFEIIISDGNSTDNTIKIAEKYADKIITSNKKGISFGRNIGAKYAKSDVFCFIDSDTIIPKNYLSSVYPVISGDHSIGALSCAFKFDHSSKSLRAVESICNNYLMIKGFHGKGEILGFNCVICKNYFHKSKGFPDKPLEDGALSIKMRNIGKVIFLPEPRVITSSRRFSNNGIVKTSIYYAGLSLSTNIDLKRLKNVFTYRKI
ncbi:MAG: glycosyltransferase [Candidatus Micrarchaeia archaeon]